MQPISAYKLPEVKRGNPRGDLLKYFSEKLHKPIGYVAMRVTGFTLEDLYYLRSICDSEEKRGTPFGKVFYGSLKVTNNSLWWQDSSKKNIWKKNLSKI